jgi:hypothetical protein
MELEYTFTSVSPFTFTDNFAQEFLRTITIASRTTEQELKSQFKIEPSSIMPQRLTHVADIDSSTKPLTLNLLASSLYVSRLAAKKKMSQ